MSFFVKEIVDETYGNYFELTGAGYGALVAAMVFILLLGCMVSGAGDKKKVSTKQLVFSAMAMALATVTSMIKLADLPMGGSVTLLSMLFICLIGYLFGLRAGLMTAVAHGILQLVIDPYIISIPQIFTDYIFGFGALGLSGVFSNKKYGLIRGYLLGFLADYFLRFCRESYFWKLCIFLQHVCSGLFPAVQRFLSGTGSFDHSYYSCAAPGFCGTCQSKKHDC